MARLPTPTPRPARAVELDSPPPVSSSMRLVTPVEPSTPLEHCSSPTLDQYHLSPTQNQARRPSMVNAPQLPPPTLAPIQPQYDVSPPRTRLEGLDKHNAVASVVAGMRSTDIDSVENEEYVSKYAFDKALTRACSEPSQTRTTELGSVSVYNVSEEEIAALGLAALDGVQEDEADSAVNSETQVAPELASVPDSDPGNRPHKVPTSKPSEGSSDKRFLCYICIKLFTRRRSVRDHIKKIHNDTNFDMARAIEVTVDPETGQSLIPLPELVKTLPVPAGGQEIQRVPSRAASRASSMDANTFSTPALMAGKKRLAPDTVPTQATALKKKGTAKPRPVITGSKKVKPEIDSAREAGTATAFRSPSATPVSSRESKTPGAARPKKQPSLSLASSPAPSERMSIAPATDNEADDEGEQAYLPAEEAEDNEAGDDDEVFCICRKGDNHTWMIGCDGGCEDWFHGKCVNIQERDGDLIDKYICPNCEDKGRGQTTWKRMCRRKQCRKPARVLAEPPSKYCSEECKKRFWVGLVERSDPNALVRQDGLMVIGSKLHQGDKPSKKRKRQKPKEDEEYNDTNNADEESEYLEGGMKPSPSLRKKKEISPTITKSRKNDYVDRDAISSDEEPLLPTNGGALSLGDIKMILSQAGTVDDIRKLGQKPPTPPYTSDVDGCYPDTEMVDGVYHSTQQEQKPFPYNSEERAHLERLSAKKRRLDHQMQFLRDQEKFLGMIKKRSTAIIDEMDVPRAKNVCGFDARLSWSNAEFEDWRTSTAGRAELERGEVGEPDPSAVFGVGVKEERLDPDGMVDGVGNELDGDEHYHDDDNDDNEDDEDEDGVGPRRTVLRGICIRNKCPRHREWRRLLASEYKFEEEGVRRQMRKVEVDGKEVRDRAAMRVLCEQD
jgi:PHD-finger